MRYLGRHIEGSAKHENQDIVSAESSEKADLLSPTNDKAALPVHRVGFDRFDQSSKPHAETELAPGDRGTERDV